MFKAIRQLKALFSEKNLRYLDVILSTLTDREDNKVYDAFWETFRKSFPHQSAANEAWTGLRRLHNIVKDQLRKI